MAGADFSGGVRTDSLTASGAIASASAAISGAAAVGSLTVAGEAVSGGGSGITSYPICIPFVGKGGKTEVFGVLAVKDPVTITNAEVAFPEAPSSALGTVVVTLSNYDASATADDNLLAAANQDVEVAVAKTPLALTLTETAADLILAEGDFVSFTLVSDNGDMSDTDGAVLTLTVEPVS
jgi:hypothetical protein